MSLLNPDKHFIGMDEQMTGKRVDSTCINCGSPVKISKEAHKFANVHAICPVCHDYTDVDHSGMIEKRCPHCWAVSFYLPDEAKTCKKCHKSHDEPVDKSAWAEKQTIWMPTSPTNGVITRRFL